MRYLLPLLVALPACLPHGLPPPEAMPRRRESVDVVTRDGVPRHHRVPDVCRDSRVLATSGGTSKIAPHVVGRECG